MKYVMTMSWAPCSVTVVGYQPTLVARLSRGLFGGVKPILYQAGGGSRPGDACRRYRPAHPKLRRGSHFPAFLELWCTADAVSVVCRLP